MKQNKRLNNTGRVMLMVVTALFFLFFIGIAYLFIDIAVTGEKKGNDLNQYALNVYLVEDIVQGKRGTIYDRVGNPLAEQLTSYTIYANLFEGYGDIVEDPLITAQQLSTVIDIPVEKLVDILTQEGKKQVEFGSAGRQLTYLEKEKIDEMELSGIKFNENVKRFYPNGVFASHTLGYTKWYEDKRTLVGEMGLEMYFDEFLAGKNGRVQYLKDKKGYVQPNKEEFVIEQVADGFDIYLTLDSTIQTFLEEAMDQVQEQANPKSMVAVVANPKTGELMGIGNRGSFDPNLRNIENYNNPIISEPFEPGSTMKIYTYAAAINEGKYNGGQYFKSGSRLVNGATIRDYNQTWGTITYNEGFYRSSNTAIIDILTNEITPETNIEYFEKFGFGSIVGLPIPDEYSGTMPTDWDITQKLTAGFGQGILTTPVQHIQAISAILNEGKLIKPQLIEKVYDPNKKEMIYQVQTEIVGNPITTQTAQTVKDLMVSVVEHETGSGKAYQLNNFTSGGKTGTAQIAGPNGYLSGSNDYVYSYIGFAPVEDPQLVMYIAMTQPETGGHDMLGQIYKYVMQNGLIYLGAEKTPISNVEDSYQKVEIKKYINKTIGEVEEELISLNLQPIIIGSGSKVFAQSPSSGTIVLEGSKVFVQSSSEFVMPDFTNWTKDEIVSFASLTGIDVTYQGEGRVTGQSIMPGESASKGSSIQLELALFSVDVDQPVDEELESEIENPILEEPTIEVIPDEESEILE
ncbi:MAG: penicillin-binding protein [Turicibacter sp.]